MSKARVNNSMMEWKSIPWRKLERKVFKLQKRIFKASQRGDVKAVRKLQKTLMKSWSAKCIAVRRVTQDNQGKKTAGVDGVRSLTPKQRTELVRSIKLTHKSNPTRRVWIPKPGNEEKRPLGIPTITDRALQALVKQALEPEWEAKFEPNSYGFRPGRSCHDAIEAIFSSINRNSKYVLDADIAKCFDKINHEALLEKLQTFPSLRKQIKLWLKSGVMDGNRLFPTPEGTPQGGVISPLLANIALHGIENLILKEYPKGHEWKNGKTIRRTPPTVIRYADDFLILHKDLHVITRCQEIISKWLKDMGLELKPSKTQITHTAILHEGKIGFNFLGFKIKQLPVGKNHSKTNQKGEQLDFKTIITPCNEKIKEHYEKLSSIVGNFRGVSASQKGLIQKLNPIIRGWSNYYRTVVSKKIFSKLDNLMFRKLMAWGRKRHPNKSLHWIINRYWKSVDKNHWKFGCSDKIGKTILRRHDETLISRFVKVRGNKSTYDGDWIYWSSRMGKHPETPTAVSKLLKAQKGKCPSCGLFFKSGDHLEKDHIVPRSKGGKDIYKNLQMLHRHCHHQKSATDRTQEDITSLSELE